MNLSAWYAENRAVVWLLIVALVFLTGCGLRAFVRRFRRSPSLSGLSDGYEFESYMAGLLERAGYTDVDPTKKSGDFGVDVLARRDEVRFAVQCKLYSQPVGVKAVQEALSGKLFYDCHVGVVATNSTFTDGARALAEKTGILLWDGAKLAAMDLAAQAKK